MRKFLLLFVFLAPSTLLKAGGFTLDEISKQFPSRGYEEQIQFWEAVFSRYGEKDVLFHDREDLRLIYDVAVFDGAPGKDPGEAKRRRKILKARKERLASALRQLGAGQKSAQMKPDTLRLSKLLEAHGYSITPEVCGRLADNIRMQSGIKEKFREGIIQSGKYRDAIERIFRQQGLPSELALLPHIESSFQYQARSSAGAAGLWQFVRGTGRAYLTINRSVDERLDPVKSTEAAARELKKNYEALGNWPLAITAYNHGRNGMLRAARKHGRDLRKIIQRYESRSFGFASRNFYAEFLAAVLVTRNHEDYFGLLAIAPAVNYETVRLHRALTVGRALQASGVSEEVLREYNPHLTRRVWRRKKLPAGVDLRVPVGASGNLAAWLGQPAPARPSSGETIRYRVRQGDTLLAIALRFGVSLSSLERLNEVRNRHRIYPGQSLRIPADAMSTEPIRYRVRRGDTLEAISRRFRVSMNLLKETNGIRNPHRIQRGQVLLIPQ